MSLFDQPDEGGTRLSPTPRIALAGMTTLLNASIAFGELEIRGLFREVDAQSHELPVGRGNCIAAGGILCEENVRVVPGDP